MYSTVLSIYFTLSPPRTMAAARERRRRRRQLSTTVAAAIAVLISCSTRCCRAEDAQSSSYASSSSSTTTTTTQGYLQVQPFCKKTMVQVTAVYLTCDSPGAYYYGSGNYRKSVVCMSNDKANLKIEFTISPYFTGQYINTSIEFGLYDHFQSVATNLDLCTNFSPVSSSTNVSCPAPGNYAVQTYYSVPEIRDYGFHYTPDVKLTFTDQSGNRLGCGTTGTVAMHRQADNKAAAGIWALGISCVAFLLVFSLLLYLSYLRKKRLEQLSENHKQQQPTGRQQYQYFRTLPNGQVIPFQARQHSQASSAATPLSRHPPLVRMSSSGSAVSIGGTAYATARSPSRQISNPLYNETQLPTRPII